jgi:PAS domain S-box-containing protein
MGGYNEPTTQQGVEGIMLCALEGVNSGIAVIDSGLSLALANGKLWDLLGLSERPYAIGTPWIEIARHRLERDIDAGLEVGPLAERINEVQQRTFNSLNQALSYQIRSAGGRVVEVLSQPTVLPKGGPWKAGLGCVRTFTDITGTIDKESALTVSRDRYALALRATSEGIYDWDIGSNTIFFSERLRDLFGLASEYLSPEDWSCRILPEDLDSYRAAHLAHLKGHTDRFVCEYRMRCGDGRIAWVRQHGVALRDQNMRAMRLTGSVGDVTEYRRASEALRQSEERYATAMQALNEGVYEWVVDDDEVHVTDRLRELFCLTAQVIPSSEWVDRVHPDDRSYFLRCQRSLLKGEQDRLIMEYRLSAMPQGKTPDPAVPSHWRWILQRGIALRDDQGRALRVIGASGDITDRRHAEQALRQSQEDLAREQHLLKATLENMDQGIFMADPSMQLRAYNQRFCEMFGLDEVDLLPGITMPDVLQQVWRRGEIPLTLERATEKFLGHEVCTTLNTHEIRRPSGRVLEARTVPLPDGSFVRTFTDVTERKAAEDSVRELIEAMPLPLVVTNISDHTVLYANTYAQNAYAIWPGMGSVKSAYVDPSEREELVARLARDGQVNAYETRLRNPHGGEEWALMSARRLVYDGVPALLVASSVITERKTLENDLQAAKTKAEEALRELQNTQQSLIEAEKMASLGGLVAGVAHEINTPVGITLTTASHLQEKVVSLKRLFDSGKIRKQEFADFMDLANNACTLLLSNCTRAANLIQSFKQVAVDQASDERRRFMLGDYINEVLLSVGPRLKRTPHKITVSCPEDLEVDSYPGPLSQILTNFVMNSLLHGFDDETPGQMTITVTPPDDKGMIGLRYADSGKGIPPENLKHVFEPFFTTRRGEGGSGLGLNIVYNLVKQTLKGSIHAEANPGGGAAFVLSFPQRLSPTALPTADSSPKQVAPV